MRVPGGAEVLGESDLPIKQVASGLGYKHQSNFTRAFNRMAGMAPLDYRRSVGEGT